VNETATDYRNTYREQLDRVRRFRARLAEQYNSQLVFQDIIWSFFQHCWHLKDWVMNDHALLTDVQKREISAAVHATGSPLLICRDLCNGTKHLALNDPSSWNGRTASPHGHHGLRWFCPASAARLPHR
jgi:hypothetical protein